MFGRPYLHALAAAGEVGMDHLLDELSENFCPTPALVGRPTAADPTPSIVELEGSGVVLESRARPSPVNPGKSKILG